MTTLIAGVPTGMEWIILLLVALLIFGGTRLAGLGKGAGRAVREFKEETAGLRKKDEAALTSSPTTTTATTATTPATQVTTVEETTTVVEQPRA